MFDWGQDAEQAASVGAQLGADPQEGLCPRDANCAGKDGRNRSEAVMGDAWQTKKASSFDAGSPIRSPTQASVYQAEKPSPGYGKGLGWVFRRR
jgi:hypothetical protein